MSYICTTEIDESKGPAQSGYRGRHQFIAAFKSENEKDLRFKEKEAAALADQDV
jgi:hypothetical protein